MTTLKLAHKYGPWAVVTGASSGIGEEFCRQLAASHINLALVARRKDRLHRLAHDLERRHGIETRVIASDLSREDCLQQIVDATAPLDVGLLVNNAGFALTGRFLDHSLDEELALLHVNCRAPLMLAHTFGRKMVQRGGGGIVNVSSASGFMSLPFWTHYAATKAYGLHLAEGLWFELRTSGVEVLALCPGSTDTEFARVAGRRPGVMKPEAVVAQALRHLGKRSTTVVGVGNRMIVALSRLLPRPWMTRMGARVVRSMATAESRARIDGHV